MVGYNDEGARAITQRLGESHTRFHNSDELGSMELIPKGVFSFIFFALASQIPHVEVM